MKNISPQFFSPKTPSPKNFLIALILFFTFGTTLVFAQPPCADNIAGFTTLGEYEGSMYYLSDDVSRPTDAEASFAFSSNQNEATTLLEMESFQLENLYPNPANDFIFTKIKSVKEEAINVLIYDARGLLLKTQQVNLVVGSNKIRLEINDLPKGVYSVFVPNVEGGNGSLRFIKMTP